jgi:formylglycine-generating enzyme required for sulfatase activity
MLITKRTLLAMPSLGLFALIACGGVTESISSGSVRPSGGPADVGPVPDANKDAGKDGGKLGGPEDCDMPASLPDHPDAKQCVDRPGAPCVPGGWFCLAKWTPYWSDRNPDDCLTRADGRAPKKLVWLDAYQLDAYEVNNETYQEYRVKEQSPAPPNFCDDRIEFDPEKPPKEQREPTDWDGGQPKVDRLKYPVACLTRQVAYEYCKYVGGRLPTALEYMRAGQREAPSLQRLPWGNDLPYTNGDIACEPRPGFSTSRFGPARGPVEGFTSDRGPYGHYSLVSNVGEWLATCREDLEPSGISGDAPTVVAAGEKTKLNCDKSVLIAGYSNETLVGQNIAEVVSDGNGRNQFVNQLGLQLFQLGYASAGAWAAGPGGNGFASNRVGFRCAYDLP